MDTITVEGQEYQREPTGRLVPVGKSGVKHSYTPAKCTELLTASSKGGSPSVWCKELGISLSTLSRWCKEFPEFNEAHQIALTANRADVETALLEQGIDGAPGNTNALKFYAMAVLGMTEKQEVQQSTELTITTAPAFSER